MHKTVLDSAPDGYPVTLQEAKDHLNVTSSSKDDYIDSLIAACTVAVERYLNRALLEQTWKVFYDRWCDVLKVPFPPLQTVESVKFFDVNGSETTLDASTYWVVTSEDPGSVQRKFNTVYPVLEYERPDAIEISFTAGYGEAADVPAPIKHGIKLMLTEYYEHKGATVIGPASVNKIPGHVEAMLHPYRIYNF